MQRSEVVCDEISTYPTDRLESFASRAVGCQAEQSKPRMRESGSDNRISRSVYALLIAAKRRALLLREKRVEALASGTARTVAWQAAAARPAGEAADVGRPNWILERGVQRGATSFFSEQKASLVPRFPFLAGSYFSCYEVPAHRDAPGPGSPRGGL